jgi:DNA-binding LytR/AlgR family response regulator
MQISILEEGYLPVNDQYITLTNREKTRLKLVDIIYVQADSGGVNYHTAHGVYFNWQSLKSCLLLLPESSFVQISKTVVVARPAIIGKTKSMVRVINNVELSIGRAFQDKISDK